MSLAMANRIDITVASPTAPIPGAVHGLCKTDITVKTTTKTTG